MKHLAQLYLLGFLTVVAEGSSNVSQKCTNVLANRQWYLPANNTFKYHLTIQKTRHDLCNEKCNDIDNNMSFAPFDDDLIYFTKLKSVVMWVNVNNTSCSYVLNGDRVKSKNCTYNFLCLCRERTKNVTSQSKTEANSGGNIDNRTCTSAPVVKNFTYESFTMFVTENKTIYDNCSSLCGSLGSVMAQVNDSVLQQQRFEQVKYLKLWVKNSTNPSMTRPCHFSSHGYILENTNCNRSFRCLCQKRDDINISGVKNINLNRPYNSETFWIVGERQFFVQSINLTFEKAEQNCKKLRAAIVFFQNPSEYILLSRNKTFKGKYWVGECSKPRDNKCLTLEVADHISLYSSRREQELYSICSRVVDIAEVLNHPAFVKLIKNMTIDAHKTTKMARKLKCAIDERTSSKALGAIVGVGVIAVVLTLLILSDIQRLYIFIQRR